jgi:hypothetical protein
VDVGRAFSYVSTDPRWLQKVLIAAAIILGGSLLPLVGILLLFLVYGYMVEIVRRVYQGVDSPLPEWDNAGDFFMRGLIVWLGVLIWLLPVIAVVSCVAVFASAADSSGAATLVSFCILGPLLGLVIAFAVPIVVARYAVNLTFNSMFEFAEIWVEIQRAIVPLLINLVMAIVLAFIAMAGLIACIIGVFVTVAYAYFVQAHLLGQVYRAARGLEAPSTAAF